MNKLVKYLSLCLAFCFILTGCKDISARWSPSNSEHSRWRAETLNIYFDVDNEKYLKITENGTYGKIEINGAVTEIIVDFGPGRRIYFYDMPIYVPPEKDERNYIENTGYFERSNCLFSGDCEFSQDKCVVRVGNSKGFLDDSIKQIVFKREEIPD